MFSWARIVIFAVSISLLVFSFESKAISAGDQDEDRETGCDDQIAAYQRAVGACLNEATDLDEARDCWSAQWPPQND